MPVLNFLEKALPTVGAVAGGFLGGVADVASFGALAPLINPVTGAATGGALGRVGENALTHSSLGSGVLQTAIGSAVGQGVGGFVTGALGDSFGSSIGGAITRGAAIGGSASSASTASTGDLRGKDLGMSFLQGAAIGGATGGLVHSVAKTMFSPDKLQSMATNENPKQIERDLKPVAGPVVAQKIAPAIAKAGDPNVVSNIIDNSMGEHLPNTAQPTPVPAAEPTEGQPTPSSAPQPEFGQSLNEKPTRFMNQPVDSQEVESYAQTFGIPKSQAAQELSSAKYGTASQSATLGAHAELADNLASGRDISESLNKYMETTGTGPVEAQKALESITKNPDFDKGALNSSNNPETGKIVIPKAQDAERAVLNSRMVRNAVVRTGNQAMGEVDKLSSQDIQLMDRLRSDSPQNLAKEAQDPQQFLKAAEAVKKYNDTTQALGAGQLSQRVPYRQNYGAPLLFDRSTPEGEQTYQDAVSKLKTSPGYGKGRFFKDYEEAQSFGLQRKNENFLGDLYDDINKRQNDLAQLTLAKSLNEAYPGQVKVGRIGLGENGTYKQLQIPGGSRISMISSVADDINKRAPALEPEGKFASYDKLNSNFKNLKLAGGGFHSVNVLGSYLGQQLASGRIFTPKGIGDLSDVIKSTFSRGAFDNTLIDMNSRGKLLDADAAGLKYGRGETAADIEPSGIGNKIPLLKQIHSAIFDRQIPMLKLKIFDQATQNLDRNNPEDLAKMTSIAKGLNNAFGGINREIQGLTPRQFQVAARGFLATDYNEGQLRTLANAFNKDASPAERRMAQQIVFGKALLWGGLVTAGGFAGGEFKNQTPEQTAFDILQKVIDPKFSINGYNVSLPTTQISEVGKPIEQTIKGAQTGHPLSGIQNFATNRLAALPSEALQLAGNKNYIGQNIYGTDSHGRPISPTDSAINIASGVLPIPATQAAQTATGNQNIGAALVNTVGLRATPQNNIDNLPVEQQTYLETAQKSGAPKEMIDAITNFDAVMKQNLSARNKASDKINRDIARGNMNQAKADANTFNQKLFQAISKAITPQDDQYLNIPLNGLKTPYQELTGDYLGYITLSDLSSRLTTIRNNPRKYGQEVGSVQINQ